jgi:hypothetical protein
MRSRFVHKPGSGFKGEPPKDALLDLLKRLPPGKEVDPETARRVGSNLARALKAKLECNNLIVSEDMHFPPFRIPLPSKEFSPPSETPVL